MARSKKKQLAKQALLVTLLGSSSVNYSFAATASSELFLTDLVTACDQLVVGAIDIAPATSATVSLDSQLCNNLSSEIGNLQEIFGNDPTALAKAISELAEALTPDEIPSLYTSLVQLSADQIRSIGQHLRNMRSAHKQETADTAYSPSLRQYVGGSAGDVLTMGRFSVFADLTRVDGNQDETDNEVGYDLSTDHYTVGADYRFNDNLVAGFAYGNSDASLEFSTAGNKTDNTLDHFIVYGNWYRDNFAVDTMIAYASGEFDTQRNTVGGIALGHTENTMTYLSIAGSYDFVDGPLSYGPFASFDWLDGSIDAFDETSETSSWEVAFAEQDVQSQVYAMGGQISYAASFDWGVLIPHARVEWRTELEDDRDVIVGRFLEDPTSSFTLSADKPDSNWYQASAGASVQLPHGIAAFINYEAILDYADTDLSTITLGARWEL